RRPATPQPLGSYRSRWSSRPRLSEFDDLDQTVAELAPEVAPGAPSGPRLDLPLGPVDRVGEPGHALHGEHERVVRVADAELVPAHHATASPSPWRSLATDRPSSVIVA